VKLVRSRPRLFLAQTTMALEGGRVAAAEPLLADAEHAFATIAEEPYQPSIGRAASLVANVPATHRRVPASRSSFIQAWQARRGAGPGRAAQRAGAAGAALLAAGRSNQQIAGELVVALDAVKKHVGHLLDKLGVANRTRPSPAPGNCNCSSRPGGSARR
jgi:hypothetical protein